MRGLATLGVVLALEWGVPSLHAQRARQYEVGAFGAYTRYDRAFNLDNKIGGGARLSYFFANAVGLEVEVVFLPRYTVAGTSTSFEPLIGSGSLVVNLARLARNSFYVLGGYSRLDFGTTAPYRFADHAVHGAVGDRLFLSDRVALRLEARGIYSPQTEAPFGSEWAGHIVGSAGLSVLHLGGAPPPRRLDSDRDRVVDERDACPNTPARATVDERGCPSDADADSVYTGLDKCPDTPAGAHVDPSGCPTDSDRDRVYDGIDQCPDTPAGVTVDAKGCPPPPPDADGDGVQDGADQCPNTPMGATVDAVGCPMDSDHDTVPDGIDKCPTTPAGATVDATGCHFDSDGDAVPDGLDKCPNTPAGATVDATGCPMDSDGDKVPDGLDRCPNTPAGTEVDATGCEIAKDTDRDGVDDRKDRCPGTAPNTRVDAIGCPILFREERVGVPPAPLILRGVTFQTGRSALKAESYAVLDEVAASLLAHPEIRIEIAGHTDNTGSVAVNRALSLARATAVRFYLARKGVSPSRMSARGYGPTQPAATNATAAGRAQNRRVELRKLP